VLPQRSSWGERPAGDRRSGFSTPLALDAEEPGGSMIAALVLLAGLTGLAMIVLTPLLAARQHRGNPTDG
jgi:hypothetical protein